MHRTLSKGRLLLLLAFCMLLVAPGFGAVDRFIPPTPDQIEKELLEMINRDRELVGRKPLLFHPLLQEIARSHSAKMATEGKLSHFFPGWPIPEQKMRLADVYFLRTNENVAYSQTPFSRFIHESLMNSVMHKINILDEHVLQAGIGVCKTGNDYYVSEEFAAIIDCPQAEKVTAFIENDLRGWFAGKFKMNLPLFAEAKQWARLSAQQNLIKNLIGLEPFADHKVQLINFCFNDLDTILAELKGEIKNSGIKAITVGVAWGRNLSFPGGTYSVSLLLFE
jgi:hypothetical protein